MNKNIQKGLESKKKELQSFVDKHNQIQQVIQKQQQELQQVTQEILKIQGAVEALEGLNKSI